jgi:Response regulator receiver domain
VTHRGGARPAPVVPVPIDHSFLCWNGLRVGGVASGNSAGTNRQDDARHEHPEVEPNVGAEPDTSGHLRTRRFDEADLPGQRPIDSRAAYSIVQEALTNTLKHAGSATARVVIRYRKDDLELEVADTGAGVCAGDTEGHGLIGMRERALLYGGSIEAGARDEGGFGVRATPTARFAGRNDHPRSARGRRAARRAGFRMILRAEPDIEVVGEDGDGLEAIEEATKLRPDVVLMDIRMPTLDGL